MLTSHADPLDPKEAHRILKQFDCFGATVPESADLVGRSLLLMANLSEHQMLGICADTLAQGLQALEHYAKALGYSPNPNLESVEGAVYIKFNPKVDKCYASPYTGEHRGVLVSCQSSDEDGINEMYGHLPLDLFS
jgi:Domain of unknown function (DUF1824)